MTQYENVTFEDKNGIGIITINRPKELNALNYAAVKELGQLLEYLSEDKAVKVIIITGGTNKAFAAGGDIIEMQNMTTLQARNWGKMGQSVFSKLENMSQPVIAAINGFALGGGCELAMACDIRIASEKAKFGQPEVTLGVIPGFGGTQRLPRLIGKGRAKKLLFTGEMIDAAEAFRIGLVDKVTAASNLMNEAVTMAEQIMSRSTLAVSLCKTAVNRGLDLDLESGLAYEAEVFGSCFSTADQKEGMNAFAEKRKPNFTGE
ncbi:enoyl-CoA hydratase-related protein [Clostridium sp. JN-1]|uniref:enoyl-CoA hydratase-related protein n=1 Tax=Clostridium sp. JN-1 TaxID=2483110 RepID=UPI000F0B9092|nr:enoyl-CoA hydratase-related protein [Clostridium sp. JN-1]